VIETRGLRQVYRTKKRHQVTTVDAVRGIDLTVTEGEIFGFLGPNGAGKTLLAPDSGEATVARPVYNVIAQPIMLIAGVLLPIAFAPLWLKRVADWNPFYCSLR
jgi:ABC-type Na+ transport system ATPase subunit NatA